MVGAPRVQSVAITTAPPAPPSYRAGEAIEVEVTFTEDVVVTGTPTFPLEIGSVTRDAPYVRESAPGVVVFAWTVLADDLDTDGIASSAGEIAIPAGASIVSAEGPRAASPAYTAFAGQTDHLVDGRVAAPDTGVCGRSPAIRDALVAGTGAATCGAVRDADLAALTTLSAASAGLTGIRAGDFAGLDALASLDLSGNAIAALNAGDFDGLSTVTTLDLASNSLRTLPSNAFRGLGALETLDLANNAVAGALPTDAFAGLSSLTSLDLDNNALGGGDLPAGVFDPLTALTHLTLDDQNLNRGGGIAAGLFDRNTALVQLNLRRTNLYRLPDGLLEHNTALERVDLRNNPGRYGGLATLADAGPDLERRPRGETVTLDGTASMTGPWGSNVLWTWTHDAADIGVAIDLVDADTGTPSFAAPALAPDQQITFTLSAWGRGQLSAYGGHHTTDTVVYGAGNSDPVFADAMVTREVAENSAAGTPVGAPVTASDPNGETLTYSLEGPNADVFTIVPETGQIEVEAALDYELQASYALVVRASDTAAGAGTVEVTVAVTDVTGPADPPTPGLGEATVEAVAFATVPALDAGYRIGETVRAAVTFSKTVELVGTASEVTLALRVGNRTREAAYAGGSGTDAPGPSPTRSPRATATRTGCRCERTRSMRGVLPSRRAARRRCSTTRRSPTTRRRRWTASARPSCRRPRARTPVRAAPGRGCGWWRRASTRRCARRRSATPRSTG